MCARYELTTTPEWMVERFGLRVPLAATAQSPRAFERGEVRPTNLAPVVTEGGGLQFLPWGLLVPWQSQPLINARAETLQTKPTFQPLLGSRCLVPATAYFEWRRDGKSKIKTRISVAESDGLVMAGLIGDGRFTIITCVPAPSIAHIHDRMPVILPRAAEVEWVNAHRSFTDVQHLLRPFAAALTWEEIKPASAQADLFA